MCFWNTDAPGGNKVKIWQISKSYIWPRPPQGHVMSVKCEEPIDELAVQLWLLYHHPNFKYCTLFVSGTEWRTDRQTDGRTDDPITRCPRRTFQARGIKIENIFKPQECKIQKNWCTVAPIIEHHGEQEVQVGYFCYEGHSKGYNVIDLGVIWQGFISFMHATYKVSISCGSKVMANVIFLWGDRQTYRYKFHFGGIKIKEFQIQVYRETWSNLIAL